MAKRPITSFYMGTYSRKNRVTSGHASNVTSAYKDLRCFANMAANYIWTAYNVMGGNYVAAATIIVIVFLSFLLPDISQKLHVSKEIKAVKKVLDLMSQEVNRAEAACLTVADEICCMHYSVRDDTTETSQDHRDLSVCTSSSLRATQSAPVQVEKKIGFFRRIFFPHRNTSHKEIAIMSYVYTNSFDAKKSELINDTKKAEA